MKGINEKYHSSFAFYTAFLCFYAFLAKNQKARSGQKPMKIWPIMGDQSLLT
jgi:hypothetical protein